MSSATAVDAPYQVYTLDTSCELRVAIGEQPVRLELVSGSAEIYGTEMVVSQVYAFPKYASMVVHSYYGCAIKVTGTPISVNVVTDPEVTMKLVLHAVLEQGRRMAETLNRNGPVTLFAGPTNVGKIELCRLLLNYAVRLGKHPLFIDLDVAENYISIPGTIGMVRIERQCDIVTAFEGQSVEVYHFGYKRPGRNIGLYFLLLKKLGEIVKLRLRSTDSNMKSSGIIINGCEWVHDYGHADITLAAKVFDVDRLVVLSDQRLYRKLHRSMPSSVEVFFMPNLGAAVERSRSISANIREAGVLNYFYGTREFIHPYMYDVNFDDIQLFKVYLRGDPEVIDSSTVTVNDVKLHQMVLGPLLINQVLALSAAETVTDEIMLTNVVGFVCVTHVDISRGIISVLSPQPGPLPKKILLMGAILLIDRP